MAVFTQPTASEFLDTILVGGDGGQFYSWDEETITRNSSSMIPIIPNEFAYASGLLTAAGYDINALSADDFALANKALLYGIAYNLLQHSEQGSGSPISGENSGGVMQTWLNSRNFQFFTLCGQTWAELGITATRYTWDFTAGFSLSTVERFPLRGDDAIISPYTD